MNRIVPVYKRLPNGVVVFDHTCEIKNRFGGMTVASMVSRVFPEKRGSTPKPPKRKVSSGSGDSAIVEVDLPPRLARRVFIADRPLERTKGRKNSLKRVSWKEGREAQFRPVSA